MSLADIIIIALVALFAIFGVLRGAHRSALTLVAFVVAFVIALFTANVISEAILGLEAAQKFVLSPDGFSLFTLIKEVLPESSAWVGDGYAQTHFYAPIIEIIKDYGYIEGVFGIHDGMALYLAFNLFSLMVGLVIFIVARML